MVVGKPAKVCVRTKARFSFTSASSLSMHRTYAARAFSFFFLLFLLGNASERLKTNPCQQSSEPSALLPGAFLSGCFVFSGWVILFWIVMNLLSYSKPFLISLNNQKGRKKVFFSKV